MPKSKEYDVFLSHSHADANLVEELASRLEDEAGLRVWLDQWVLIPGENWQHDLDKGLSDASSCAVFISTTTTKGWFDQEIRRALDRASEDNSFRVIPVLLPNANPNFIDGFLKQRTWVDFRGGLDDNDAFHRLVAGIRGEAPGRGKLTTQEKEPDEKQSIESDLPKFQKTRQFSPIPITPGFGNSYMKNLYIDYPKGDVDLGGIIFHLPTNTLIFDTNDQIRYSTQRKDGSIEIELRLPKPTTNIKSVHILTNSGNSKYLYLSEEIGEIILVFQDAPPIASPLILGTNIREWCLGNPGSFVRTISNPLSTNVWKGISTSGANAIMDCLQIPVHDLLRSATLEKIIFVHKPTQHLEDELGVHFLVFAITLELEIDNC